MSVTIDDNGSSLKQYGKSFFHRPVFNGGDDSVYSRLTWLRISANMGLVNFKQQNSGKHHRSKIIDGMAAPLKPDQA